MWAQLIRIVITVIFLGLAALLIFGHSVANLNGRGLYKDETVVSSSIELIQFITDQKKASAHMNVEEIAILVALPWFFITAVLLLWRSFQWTMIVSLVVIVIIFGLASATNHIGVNRQLAEELPIWESKFKVLEDPRIKEYTIEDAVTFFDRGHYGVITVVNVDGSGETFIYFGIPDGHTRVHSSIDY